MCPNQKTTEHTEAFGIKLCSLFEGDFFPFENIMSDLLLDPEETEFLTMKHHAISSAFLTWAPSGHSGQSRPNNSSSPGVLEITFKLVRKSEGSGMAA